MPCGFLAPLLKRSFLTEKHCIRFCLVFWVQDLTHMPWRLESDICDSHACHGCFPPVVVICHQWGPKKTCLFSRLLLVQLGNRNTTKSALLILVERVPMPTNETTHVACFLNHQGRRRVVVHCGAIVSPHRPRAGSEVKCQTMAKDGMDIQCHGSHGYPWMSKLSQCVPIYECWYLMGAGYSLQFGCQRNGYPHCPNLPRDAR